MKLFKKVGILIVSFVLALGAFSGCNGVTRDSNTVLISFAEAGIGREWLEEAIKDYQVIHPEVKFEIEGDAGITAKILPRLESGTELPDIFFGLQTNWQMWAYQGFLEPLDDLYAMEVDNGKTYAEKVEDELLDYGKVNGHYYGGAWNSGVNGLVYNHGMFTEKGWKIPETVDELLALCETIKNDPVNSDADRNNNIAPFAWGGQVGKYWDFAVLPWWAQYEGMDKVVEFNKFESAEVFKQPGRLKALEAFEKIMADSKNSVAGAMSKNHITSQMDFISGRGAMIPNGSWIQYEMRKSIDPTKFDMRMMQTPAIDKDHKVKMNYTASGDFFVIPKEAPSESKKLAKDFLAFMATDAQLRKYTKITSVPRGFEYSLDDLGELTPFTQSVIDIYKSSENIYMYSNNPIYYKNFVNTWPATGAPYGMIADGDTAKSCFDADYNKAVAEWANWLEQVK